MFARSKSQVLKAINHPSISLDYITGHYYWSFVYDNGTIYETSSVYTPRLSDMTVDQWVEEARSLIEKSESN